MALYPGPYPAQSGPLSGPALASPCPSFVRRPLSGRRPKAWPHALDRPLSGHRPWSGRPFASLCWALVQPLDLTLAPCRPTSFDDLMAKGLQALASAWSPAHTLMCTGARACQPLGQCICGRAGARVFMHAGVWAAGGVRRVGRRRQQATQLPQGLRATTGGRRKSQYRHITHTGPSGG